ncbi:Hypothetical_protein [Hexamita inflata]|uniref:Hypothetical_protein n=1 Tax=Hexamita inflata TaxID=28002 RepID=A0AA86TLB6_9EUKA|nr:Hypothetical protein HINF_LOCUS3963 [Hexamita inflata]
MFEIYKIFQDFARFSQFVRDRARSCVRPVRTFLTFCAAPCEIYHASLIYCKANQICQSKINYKNNKNQITKLMKMKSQNNNFQSFNQILKKSLIKQNYYKQKNLYLMNKAKKTLKHMSSLKSKYLRWRMITSKRQKNFAFNLKSPNLMERKMIRIKLTN